MLHLGDITKINGYEAPTVDVVIGGSPCQDLSIAGKRAGLDGERSGLFMEQLRIIKEMRENDRRIGRTGNNVRPRFMVWENVPGAFSSHKGEDFRIVLEETAKVADENASIPMPTDGKWRTSGCILGNGWSIAWRVLDAQFWGVPQRRRRIALVADFGGESASEILFVRKSVSGHSEQGESQRKATPKDATGGTGADNCFCIDGDKLNKKERNGGSGIGYRDGDKQYTLTAKDVHGVAYTLKVRSGCEGGGKGALLQTEKSATLSTSQDQTLFQPVPFVKSKRAQSPSDDETWKEDNIANTMNAFDTGDVRATEVVVKPVYSIENHPADSRVDIDESGKVQTLTGRMGTGGGNVPMVMESEVIALDRASFNQGINAQYDFEVSEEGVNSTIVAKGPSAVCYSVDQGGGKSARNIQEGQAPTLTCTHGGKPAVCYSCDEKMGNTYVWEDQANTLAARDYKQPQSVCYSFDALNSNSMKSSNPNSGCREVEVARTIDTAYPDPSKNQGGVAIVKPITDNEYIDTSHADDVVRTDKVVSPLQARDFKGGKLVRQRYTVRRLTPLECERLQGYPDGWTDIGEWTDSNGKKRQTSDAARYKALGNSIALPPWKWVLKRLCACYERDATMASLFDGIGGFPLIWEQLNGKGSCLWASEIDEFPMAVTKVRTGGE